jgi:hypothetical protein
MNKKGGLIGWLWFAVVVFSLWVLFFRTERLIEVVEQLKDVCRASTQCVGLFGKLKF